MKANNYLVVPLNQSISAKMHIAISLYKTHLSLAVYAITYYLLINSLTLINCLQIITITLGKAMVMVSDGEQWCFVF